MPHMPQIRHSKGTAKGGQFAPDQNAEASSELVDFEAGRLSTPRLADRMKSEIGLLVDRSEQESDEVVAKLRSTLVAHQQSPNANDTYETLRICHGVLRDLYKCEQRFIDGLDEVRSKMIKGDRQEEDVGDSERASERLRLWNNWQTEHQIGLSQSREAIAGAVSSIDDAVVADGIHDPHVLTGIAWAHLTRRNAAVRAIAGRIEWHLDRFDADVRAMTATG